MAGQEPFVGIEIYMDEVYRLLSSRCLSRDPENRPLITTATVDPCNRRPTIGPEDSLAKYGISFVVDSVYYHPDGDSNAGEYACAVVLEVGFLPPGPGRDFLRATFSTCVPHIRLDRYPNTDEVVAVDINGAGASLGGYNRQKEREAYRILLLQPQKTGYNEIRWIFRNEDLSRHFPATIKLLLLVRDINSFERFPFTLEIRMSEVCTRLPKRLWHIQPKTMRLQEEFTDDWRCEINDNYFPETAEGILREYQKPLKDREPSKMVGLRAALSFTPTVPQK